MSLLKKISSQQFVDRSQCIVFEAATFSHGFQQFLEALQLQRLIKEPVRTKTENGYLWDDSRSVNGIKLETTEHPFVKNNYAGDVIIEGTPEVLDRVKILFDLYEVQCSSLNEVVDLETERQLGREKMNMSTRMLMNKNLQRLGAGKQTTTFKTRSPNSVVRHTKILDPKTDPHLKFLKIAQKHQDNPFFPRIYNAKLYAPTREQDPYVAMVEMEKLVPITSDMFGTEEEKVALFHRLGFDEKELQNLDQLDIVTLEPMQLMQLAQATHNEQFAQALNVLATQFRFHGTFDLHSGNWMIRPTSTGPQIVIVDPVYMGQES